MAGTTPWVFGYGSLIYKVDFPYLERRPASIYGWMRRFWQGSYDHRGLPNAPGRVLTLCPQVGALCHGVAYRVEPEVLAHLDFREKNGYVRVIITMNFDDDDSVDGIVYIASEHNEAYLGDAPLSEIAAHIQGCAGPSGSNRDYVLQLADALRDISVHDSEVFALERLLLAMPER